MSRFFCGIFSIVVLVAGFSTDANAETVTVDAADSGQYQVRPTDPSSLSHGLHIANNRNYAVIATGSTLARNFFVFDSDQLPANIASARLLIENKFTTGGEYTVRSVTVPLETLTANHTSNAGSGGASNLAEGVAIYEALDDGVNFGCATLAPYNWNTDPEVPQTKSVEVVHLNSAAVAALNAATGEIAIAGAIDAGQAFSSSDLNDTVSLVVSTESDPAAPDPCATMEASIDADDSGQYQVRPSNPSALSHGLHIANNRNYAVIGTGSTLARNFFVFDTDLLPAGIASAHLLIDNKFTTGGEYTLRGVTVPLEMLTANHTSNAGPGGTSNLPEGVAIYEALDDGAEFGCSTLTPYNWNTDPEIPQTKRVEVVRLNAAAVSALNAANGQLAFAGAIDAGQAFSSSDLNDTVRLVVSSALDTTAPDPCVTNNLPPTAVAGADQAIRPGDVAYLDGSASFDDNDDVADLTFAWAFVDWPGAPAAPSPNLLGAFTANPSFTAADNGTYELQLVVGDTGGLSSAPAGVIVSTDNLAPTAVAGADRLVLVGQYVGLDGSASTDPEGDPITFAWDISEAPAGSTAVITGSDAVLAAITPDAPGSYLVDLVASDLIGPSIADSLEIVALTEAQAVDTAVGSVFDAIAALDDVPVVQLSTKGNGGALANFMKVAGKALAKGETADAIDKINQALERTDGCALRGAPDPKGEGRDWIVGCAEQALVYNALQAALAVLLL